MQLSLLLETNILKFKLIRKMNTPGGINKLIELNYLAIVVTPNLLELTASGRLSLRLPNQNRFQFHFRPLCVLLLDY